MGALGSDLKTQTVDVVTVAYRMLERYVAEHPHVTGGEKSEFFNTAVTAIETELESSADVSLSGAIALAEKNEAFVDKYRCGIVDVYTNITGKTPACVNVLAKSFLPLPPRDFESVEEMPPPKKRSADRSDVKVPIIASDDPSTIRNILKEQYPSTYDEFNTLMNRLSYNARGRWSEEDVLKALAQISRLLGGRSIKDDRYGMVSAMDLLSSILISMDLEYQFPETLTMVIDNSFALVNRDPDMSFNELFDLFDVCRSFQFRELPGCTDSVVVGILFDFYNSLLDSGLSFDSIDKDQLVGIYNMIASSNNEGEAANTAVMFKEFLGEIKNYLVALKENYENHPHCYSSEIDALIGSLPKYGVTAASVREKAGLFIQYAGTLHARGEKDIQRAFRAFHWNHTEITPEFLEKVLLLHEYYGWLDFPRLQGPNQDEDLIDELIKNIDPKYNADRPLAVVAVARNGEGTIFDTFSMGNFYNMLKALSKGYKLMAYSRATQDAPLQSVQAAYERTGKKTSVLIEAGHGDQFSTNFGADAFDTFRKQKDRLREKGFIDYGKNLADQILEITDRKEIRAVDPFLEDGAPVIAYSCSTGKGREKAVNMANVTAYELPGHVVYAPDADTQGVVLNLGTNNLLKSLKFLRSSDRDENSKSPTKTYAVVRRK